MSRSQKIKYWNEVQADIENCLDLYGEFVPFKLAQEVKEYLSHNELGIALEIIADMAIDNEWKISGEAKNKILGIFKKMDYSTSDPEQYDSYLKNISKL